MSPLGRQHSPTELAQQVLAGERRALAQALTLAESQRPDDRPVLRAVLEAVQHKAGSAYRIGITGAPGVGKSSFIEAFGSWLVQHVGPLAVLTVDPSSERTGGSILGDKTRMQELSSHPKAFIRPSASGKAGGGVTRSMRESILLCEAAGYELILVETVGVGQSELAVRQMVDFFMLLLLPGAGDELQGIKRGIMEMADGLVITKADGENKPAAQRAKLAYQQALHYLPPAPSGQVVPVLLSSALEAIGLEAIWRGLEAWREATQANGFYKQQRQAQALSWFRAAVQAGSLEALQELPSLATAFGKAEDALKKGVLPPTLAAEQVLQALKALLNTRN